MMIDKEDGLEYCDQAIKALKFRARIYPAENVQKAVNEAIAKVENLQINNMVDEDVLVQQIRQIWSPVFAATSKEKYKKEVQISVKISADIKTQPAQKTCHYCDYGCFARSPFGCQFKQGEPPHCAGFVWDKKGEFYNV